MNFTREPIIETIITPKEGYKLIVRSSKGLSQEEYSVDALEVVAFGPAIFYRCVERPKPFLVPIGDFEVVEVKETRVILKNVNLERSIKIGGGREAPFKQQPQVQSEEEEGQPQSAPEQGAHPDKKRDRRNRRRRRLERSDHDRSGDETQQTAGVPAEGGEPRDEMQVSSPTFNTLFPPPQTLISQTIGRYKTEALSEGNAVPPPVEKQEPKKPEREEEESKITHLPPPENI